MSLLMNIVRDIIFPIRSRRFIKRGAHLIAKYRQDGNPGDLSKAIDNYQNAVVLCPPGHPGRSDVLSCLARGLLTRFMLEGNLVDLTRAIQHYEEGLNLCPPWHPNRSALLNFLATALVTRHKVEGNLTDLARAIQYQQEALGLCPAGHPGRSDALIWLATGLLTRYKQEDNLTDLTRAIQLYEEGLDLCLPGHPGRSARLSSTATALLTRHKKEGSLTDLTRAIQYHQEALDLCSPWDPARFAFLNHLGTALLTRYRREGALADLTRIIQYHEEELSLCPPGHPRRFAALNCLASGLLNRYTREGKLADLTHSIQYHEEELGLCPPGHPSRSAALNSLSKAILARYDQEGNLADLARAIQQNEEVLDLCPPGNPGRWGALNDLANAVLTRYGQEGNPADLVRTIQYHQEALDLCPPGNPGRSTSLINLSLVFRTRYMHEGNLDDLTLAVQHSRNALDLCPSGPQDRPPVLEHLAKALQIRYMREGDLADLTSAIQYHEEALSLCIPGHSRRPAALNCLAIGLLNRYEREGNLADLTRAIQQNEEVLDLCPPGNRNRCGALNSLAKAILTRYHREGNLADLTRAVQYHQEALELCPPGDPRRPITLDYLALAMSTRYIREGDLVDLTCAVQYHEEALDLCPPGDAGRSHCLRSLAVALYVQYSRTENVKHSVHSTYHDLGANTFELLERMDSPSPKCDSRDFSRTRIIALLREASEIADCSPRMSLDAALDWVQISADLAPESTLEACTSALDRLDIALALAQSLDQVHNRLLVDKTFTKTKNLGVVAAILALRRGDLEHTVELLERGRSLLFAQIGRYRVELDDLRLADPELADRFARLSQLLDASTVSNQTLEEAISTTKDPHERYRKVSTEWTQTVDKIRHLQGFETFLKPTLYNRLRQAAAEGPVIMLIPSPAGSIALVIRNNAPIHRIDLRGATLNRLAELAHNFTHALNFKDYNDAQRERECADNLASLWNEVVGPIAQALQHDLAIPLRSRVWWCPASAASFLPLHAAGLYSKGTARDNFPAKYISSYTPTLEALRRARRPNSTSPKKMLLVISQPHTPGEPPLPYARVEADIVAKIMSSTGTEPLPMMTPLLSESGTREAVQSEMASHPWVHFICHGVQKVNEPLESYLSLHNGPLTLREIIEQNLPNADFAFLAACHSAAGNKDLANEALHLAAAMQFAGFRGVVGTLWKMRDIDGPPLAEAFYKDMVKRGDHRRAAVALSKAINQLRRNKVPIHCWMRFVHIGA